jgi:hypothetical protein
MTVTINGTGFAPTATGVVWFDTDGDWVFDPGEPSASVNATLPGAFSTNLTVPTVAPGTYFIRADVPLGAAVEAWASFTVAAPSITLAPTSGGPGTNVTVTGGNFSVGHTGRVWFDTDHDGVFDAAEPTILVVPPGVNATGGFSVPLPPVPAVVPGTYFIRADVPSGGPVEASAPFTLVAPAITLTPPSGVPGKIVTVTGTGFNATLNITVWFDTDGDGTVNPAEPSITAMTNATGGFLVPVLTVPAVAAGTYFIRADTTVPPPAPPALASKTFTVPAPTIMLTPPSGGPGTNVTVVGTGFTPGLTGRVWFDTDGDGLFDTGEPTVTTPPVNASGGFSAPMLTVPAVAAGAYFIRADVPVGMPVEASAPFTLVTTAITLTPTSGIAGTPVTVVGTGFTPGSTGRVWFDTDGDGLFDTGEPTVTPPAVNATGGFSAPVLTVPAVAAGAYFIRADVPEGLPVEASAPFTLVTTAITLTPTSGGIGTTVTVAGVGFTVGAIGRVWFDSDGDTIFDVGEPEASVPAIGVPGNFSASLIVPTVVPGAYFIRADVPAGGPVEASATFTRLAPAITLTPTTGAPGTLVTVAGVGFNATTPGRVWFDTNHNGIFEVGELEVPVTAGPAGAFSVPLTVPTVAPGTYFIRADVPLVLPVEASASFTVPAPPPGAPALLGPAPGAIGVPLRPGFSWTPIPGAIEYEFILSTESDLTPTVAGTPVRVPRPSWHVPVDLAYGTTYFWAVRVIMPVPGPVSIGTFTTIPAPPPVVTPAWVWVLITIGAVLVIVIVVLIFRTRRV